MMMCLSVCDNSQQLSVFYAILGYNRPQASKRISKRRKILAKPRPSRNEFLDRYTRKYTHFTCKIELEIFSTSVYTHFAPINMYCLIIY